MASLLDYKIKFFGETNMKSFMPLKKHQQILGIKTGNESEARLIAEK